MRKVYTLDAAPVSKPRMTRRDKWMKRPCVVRYRAWADALREAARGREIRNPVFVRIHCVIEVPKTWSKQKKKFKVGTAHRNRPDADNILKGIVDALWKEDKGIASMQIKKVWGWNNYTEIEAKTGEGIDGSV